MSDVIQVSNLSKGFFQDPLWRRLGRWLLGLQAKRHHRAVLTDINFHIPAGQSVGVVGVNGAGKSTLLKLLVGTLVPSHGEIVIHGRISAILELGMGLNESLTARQNARLSLAMYGVPSQQIDALLPWVEAFSELGPYFDEPVRVFSSGMTMRLAFSIATSYQPDILIVDEALSVGDAYFQHKCAEHIRSMQAQGATLLFVSHDLSAVQALCDRALLLDQGRIVADGEPEHVLSLYNALLSPASRDNPDAHAQINQQSGAVESGTRRAMISGYQLAPLDPTINRPDVEGGFWVGETVVLSLVCQVQCALDTLVVGLLIKDRLGQLVYGTNTHHLQRALTGLEPDRCYRVELEFPLNLGAGSYALTLALTPDDTHLNENFHWIDRAMVIEVFRPPQSLYSIGVIDLPVRVRYQEPIDV